MRALRLWQAAALALAAGIALSLGGCPPANQAPTVDAGADQNVNGGDPVTLTATATDPDGDTLGYAWTQQSGTAVVLANATTATATFIAPNVTGALTFQILVGDGNEGTDTDTVTVNVTQVAGNIAPVANAGADQTVNGGDAVTLAGIGTDADGDALTFAWAQTGGTAVVLNNANTANATFTAPATLGDLTFQLTVNDGTVSDTDDVIVTVEAPPALLVASFAGSNVVTFDLSNPAALNGNIAPSANLSGAQTLLAAPADIVVTANGTLLSANAAGASLTGYANAFNFASINCNVPPVLNVSGAATGLVGPISAALSPGTDTLFVALTAGTTINVYANSSQPAFNGNVAPTRTITSAINNVRGINFGANDTLYVVSSAPLNNVTVFANASTLNGIVLPTRTITSPAFNAPFDVFIDGSDRMYVVNSGNDQVLVFNNASTLNGAVNPSVTLTVLGAGTLTAIAVDAVGNGYVVDNALSAVYGYNSIATRNGPVLPDRTLQGLNTQLFNPIRVFLLE